MIEYSDLPPALVRASREVTLFTETEVTRVGTGDTSRIEEEGGGTEIIVIVTTEVVGAVVTRTDRAGTGHQALPGMNTGRGGTEMSTQTTMGTGVGRTLEGTDIKL